MALINFDDLRNTIGNPTSPVAQLHFYRTVVDHFHSRPDICDTFAALCRCYNEGRVNKFQLYVLVLALFHGAAAHHLVTNFRVFVAQYETQDLEWVHAAVEEALGDADDFLQLCLRIGLPVSGLPTMRVRSGPQQGSRAAIGAEPGSLLAQITQGANVVHETMSSLPSSTNESTQPMTAGRDAVVECIHRLMRDQNVASGTDAYFEHSTSDHPLQNRVTSFQQMEDLQSVSAADNSSNEATLIQSDETMTRPATTFPPLSEERLGEMFSSLAKIGNQATLAAGEAASELPLLSKQQLDETLEALAKLGTNPELYVSIPEIQEDVAEDSPEAKHPTPKSSNQTLISASNITHVGPIYPTRRAILSRPNKPYIHALCGAGFSHPEDVRMHHSRTCPRRVRDGANLTQGQDSSWNAHASCKIRIGLIKTMRVREGFVVLDQESLDKTEMATNGSAAAVVASKGGDEDEEGDVVLGDADAEDEGDLDGE
ncbi:hypothetical protein AAFC00_004278 [Neodothiora populina]|uniref:HNH nuclease domain-containing protein n=1 Tax=Neodothiora populina TaxID=2781224 RepID=A0ABR3PJ65_9PEZI